MDMDQKSHQDIVKSSSDDEEDIFDDKEGSEGWSLRQKALLCALCLVYIISFTALLLISPFFPNVARDKGVSSSEIGLIYAAYPLVAGAFSPVCTIFVVKWGARLVIMAGFVLAGTCQFLFGFCNMLEDKGSFVAICFILRALNGFGGAACEMAVLTIAIDEFPLYISTVMGVLECCIGIGVLISPAFGGVLYTAGGFPLPFIAVASLMFALVPLIFLTVPRREVVVAPYTTQLLYRVIRIFPIFVTAMCMFIGSACVIYIQPIFSLHMEKVYRMNATEIGLLLLLSSSIYAVFTPFMGWICDKTHFYRLMLITGFAGTSVGFLLIGPAPFLDFILPTRSLGLLCTSMIVLGLFGATLFVPIIPDMLQSAKKHEFPDDETTSSVAGIVNSMANFGLLVGSIVAGPLNQGLGFRWATTIAAFIAAFQGILLAILTYCEPQRLSRLSDQTDAEHKEFKHSYQALTTSE